MKYLPVLATAAVLVAVWLMTPHCATLPPIPKKEKATLTFVNNTSYWLIIAVERTMDKKPVMEALLSPNDIPQIPGEPPTNIVTMTLSPDIYNVFGVLYIKDPNGDDKDFIIVKADVIQVILTPGAHETRVMGPVGPGGSVKPEEKEIKI